MRYLTAATVLEPAGNPAAEVADALARLPNSAEAKAGFGTGPCAIVRIAGIVLGRNGRCVDADGSGVQH